MTLKIQIQNVYLSSGEDALITVYTCSDSVLLLSYMALMTQS